MKRLSFTAGFLLLLSTFLFTNCTADHDFVSTPREIIARGTWGIKSLYAGSDLTGQYADYTFSFGTNGTVTVTNNGEAVRGNWRWVRNARTEVLDLQLPDHSGLTALDAQWTLEQWGLYTLTLKRGTDVLTLEQLSLR